LTWFDYLLAQDDLPSVIATSYGEDEQDIPASYAHRVCDKFAQLGARGVSMFTSSGNFGVGGGCNKKKFRPHFPTTWYDLDG
jgi:tripeptidyl-peptidase I